MESPFEVSAVALLGLDLLSSLGEADAAAPIPVPGEDGMVQEGGDGCGNIGSPPEVLAGADPRGTSQSRGSCCSDTCVRM